MVRESIVAEHRSEIEIVRSFEIELREGRSVACEVRKVPITYLVDNMDKTVPAGKSNSYDSTSRNSGPPYLQRPHRRTNSAKTISYSRRDMFRQFFLAKLSYY